LTQPIWPSIFLLNLPVAVGAVVVTLLATDESRESFVYALQHGLRLGAAVAATGAVLAWRLIAPLPAAEAAPVEERVREAA
jgi:hypothetical protein